VWEKLSSQIYKHVLEPSAVDVVRIAKAAGASTGQDERAGRNVSSTKELGLNNVVSNNRRTMAQF